MYYSLLIYDYSTVKLKALPVIIIDYSADRQFHFCNLAKRQM